MNTTRAPLVAKHSRHQAAESSGSRRLIAFLAFGVFLTAAFIRPLTSLITHAAGTDLHSHILLVPFISAYLIYIRRQQLPRQYVSSWGWASVSLFVGLVSLLAMANLVPFGAALSENDVFSLTAFSFISLMLTGGFVFLGAHWMRAAAFPLAFLIFAVPLPDGIVHELQTQSKLASAEAAALFFSVAGTPVLRDGTVFQLPGIIIEVAQECSGIRSSWVLFITSVLAAYLFLKSPWRRAALIAFVIPLAIVRNGFRILVIGLLCVHVGPQMIHSMIHKQGGPLFFALSLVPLLLLLWWLRKSEIATTSSRSPEELAAPQPR